MKILLAMPENEELRELLLSAGHQVDAMSADMPSWDGYDGVILGPDQLHQLIQQGDRPEILTFGNVRLNCNGCLLSADGGSVRLNQKEYRMLECFLRHPERVFSTEELMERIWGENARVDIHVVWTNITYLRRRLEAVGANIRIHSLRGTGYSLEIQQA